MLYFVFNRNISFSAIILLLRVLALRVDKNVVLYKKKSPLVVAILYVSALTCTLGSCPLDWAEYDGECLYFGHDRRDYLGSQVLIDWSIDCLIDWLLAWLFDWSMAWLYFDQNKCRDRYTDFIVQ